MRHIESCSSKECIINLSDVPDGERFIKVVQHPIYSSTLRSYDKPSESKAEEVVQQFFTNSSVSEIDSKFNKQVMKDLASLAKTSTGYEVLDRIAKTKKKLFIIKCDDGEHSQFISGFSYLTLLPEEKYYYISINKDGEKIIQEGPNYVTLLHELVHAMTFFEDAAAHRIAYKNISTLDSCLTSVNEQGTIASVHEIGITSEAPIKILSKNNEGKSVVSTILNSPSENKLLLELGLPPRVTHWGFASYPPTLAEIVKLELINDFKEKLSNNILDKNLHFVLIKQQKISLSAHAIHFGSVKMFNLLLESGMPLNIEDDIGGVIHSAISKDRFELAQFLITEKGVDVDLKNKEGETVYHRLQQKDPSILSCKHRGPLIDKLKKEIEARSKCHFKLPLNGLLKDNQTI